MIPGCRQVNNHGNTLRNLTRVKSVGASCRIVLSEKDLRFIEEPEKRSEEQKS